MASMVKLGSKGPNVKRLQKALNTILKLQPPLVESGIFDQATHNAAKQFQRANNLGDDGKVGHNTWNALEKLVPAPVLPEVTRQSAGLPETSELSDAEKFVFYSNLMEYGKGNVQLAKSDLSSGMRVIVGLRITTATTANNGQGVYDDRIVVLWKDDADPFVYEFTANTEPSARYEDNFKHTNTKALGEDSDGDGRKDQGRVPEGVYLFAKSSSDKYGKVLRPTQPIIVERDANHDGVFDDADTMIIVDMDSLNSGDSILFHPGGKKITGSAGCQTFPPSTFPSFWSSLGAQHNFKYVLIKVV